MDENDLLDTDPLLFDLHLDTRPRSTPLDALPRSPTGEAPAQGPQPWMIPSPSHPREVQSASQHQSQVSRPSIQFPSPTPLVLGGPASPLLPPAQTGLPGATLCTWGPSHHPCTQVGAEIKNLASASPQIYPTLVRGQAHCTLSPMQGRQTTLDPPPGSLTEQAVRSNPVRTTPVVACNLSLIPQCKDKEF
jgi:hypothetical protein